MTGLSDDKAQSLWEFLKENEVEAMWVITIVAWAFFLSWSAKRWTHHPISSGLGIGLYGLDLLVGVGLMRFFVYMTPLRHLRAIRHTTKRAGRIARYVSYPIGVAALALLVVSIFIVTPATHRTAWIVFGIGASGLGACCLFLSAAVGAARVRKVDHALTLSERGLGLAWFVILVGSVLLIANGFAQVA